jgi:hypothetical protein
LGFALQKGQTKEIGLTGSMSGTWGFSSAIPKVYAGQIRAASNWRSGRIVAHPEVTRPKGDSGSNGS